MNPISRLIRNYAESEVSKLRAKIKALKQSEASWKAKVAEEKGYSSDLAEENDALKHEVSALKEQVEILESTKRIMQVEVDQLAQVCARDRTRVHAETARFKQNHLVDEENADQQS